jgi:hypothetical protein
MGIFKDLRLFFTYKKSIKKNKVELEGKFNMRIDSADRMYTVLNVPFTELEGPYNLKKADVDLLAQNYIRDYISELSTFLNSIGVSELYDFYEPIKKVDKHSYLIVIGYKQLDSVEINKIVYRFLIPILTVASLISLGIFLWKM